MWPSKLLGRQTWHSALWPRGHRSARRLCLATDHVWIKGKAAPLVHMRACYGDNYVHIINKWTRELICVWISRGGASWKWRYCRESNLTQTLSDCSLTCTEWSNSRIVRWVKAHVSCANPGNKSRDKCSSQWQDEDIWKWRQYKVKGT